ncbi:MAG: hypothetical protein QNJ49_15210, partial [Mastigocoleus sp. MO_167.B18]|nr:hypothetical protein [Mastigocoleus sp. MO_167.B18]
MISTFGLSIVLTGSFFPNQGKVQAEAFTFLIKHEDNKLQEKKQRSDISIAEWGNTENRKNINISNVKHTKSLKNIKTL